MQTLVDGPRGGKLRRIVRTREEYKADFWSRVLIGAETECWDWTGGTNDGRRDGKHSYGAMWINGVKWKAHRLAFTLKKGEIPSGLHICHHCDRPICCNPSHLYAGTAKDNAQDQIRRGRTNREMGEARYNARLTDEKVREIRNRYTWRKYGINQIASDFEISRSMAFAIITMKRWKHVTADVPIDQHRQPGAG